MQTYTSGDAVLAGKTASDRKQFESDPVVGIKGIRKSDLSGIVRANQSISRFDRSLNSDKSL